MSFDIELKIISEPTALIEVKVQSFHIHKCRCRRTTLHKYCSKECAREHLVCCNSHYWSHAANTLFLSDFYYFSISPVSKDSQQIELDVSRTMIENTYFSSKEGSAVLNRLLNRLSNFAPEVGYIQGMNFIASALLWHSSESQSFWLFYKLLKVYGLQENYSDGFPGIKYQLFNLEKYLNSSMPDILNYLQTFQITIPMFSLDWCICLFSKSIPLDEMSIFFTFFLDQGWSYFYKVVAEILHVYKKYIMKESEKYKIFSILKSVQRGGERYLSGLDGVGLKIVEIDWKKVLIAADKRV